jgi:hypothetical protein
MTIKEDCGGRSNIDQDMTTSSTMLTKVNPHLHEASGLVSALTGFNECCSHLCITRRSNSDDGAKQ